MAKGEEKHVKKWKQILFEKCQKGLKAEEYQI